MGTFLRQLLDELENYTKKRRNMRKLKGVDDPLVEDDLEKSDEKHEKDSSDF